MPHGFDGRFNISKAVGWRPREVAWPTRSEAEFAIERKDGVRLMTWTRFLPSPENDYQRSVMERICEAFPAIRAELEV